MKMYVVTNRKTDGAGGSGLARHRPLAAKACLAAALVLAAGACGRDHRQAAPGGAPPGSGNATVAACSDAHLVTAALAILDTSCYSCHGAGGATKGGPQDVTDLATLVASGEVVPKDPGASPLSQSIVTGHMPPKSSPQPSPADLAAINGWIAGGAPVLKGAQLAAAQASCKTGGNPGGGPSPGAPPGPPAPGPGQPGGLSLTAADVLSKYCGACHDGGKAAGGLGNITDLKSLVAGGLVVANDLPGSKLYQAIASAKMPPSGKAAPTAAEAQAVADWITNGAPSGGGGPPPGPPAQLLSPTDVFTLVAQDLQKVAATSASPAPFTRYLSFAHLATGGVAAADIKDFTNGASRLVNSLSQNQRITPAAPIDPNAQIVRIDIRDYNWTQQNWEDILAAYPYATLQRSVSLAQQFRELAQTDLPVVNGDWFAFTAAQAPLYNELLALPADEAGLEQKLGFSIATDLAKTLNDTASRDTIVARAGFSQSKVAINNRVIERHGIPVGSYWRSYDFKDPGAGSSAAQQLVKNVFAAPLGPVRDINAAIAFQEDAGEIIFSLPNGLQGYFLVDAQAARLDAAALDVAQDASRKKKAVLNGYSCMGCHAPGILPKNDEVGAFVATGGGFTADQLTLIGRLYGKQAALNQSFAGDTTRYLTALKAASLDPAATTPMVRSGNIYEQDIALKDAATVLGLTTQQFQTLLSNSSQALKQALAGLIANGTVTREVFEAQFPQLVTDFYGNIPAP